MFGSDVLTVVRQGRDRFGDPAGAAVETEVSGCYVQPRGISTEDTDQRTTVISGLLAFVPPGADIRPADRVRWRGDIYQVEGDPADWAPPGGPAHHLELILRRVTG
jgi:hypothetical protein